MTDKPPEENHGTLLAVMSHPLRPAILEALNEEAMSPTNFVDRGYVPSEFFNDRSTAVSKMSYHFKMLAKAGWLELVETIPRRGGTEHIYRGTGRQCFREDFDALPFEERQRLSAAGFLGMTARTERAIRSGAFDRRANRHLSWYVGKVDLEGYEDLMSLFRETATAARHVCEEAAARLSAQGTTDSEGTSVAYSLTAYESPDQR